MPLLSLERVRADLADPSLYPQTLDFGRQAVLFLGLSRAVIESASFLDDRILTAQTEGRWVRFDELAPLMECAAPVLPMHFIFHAGHVGSTLVSRLLDQAGGVLSLREPLALRVLAEAADSPADPAQLDTLLRWFSTLWARGYADTRAVVLKATSSASRLAPTLLTQSPGAQAITMNLRAEPYLATLLAGENSHIDLLGHGPERHARLSRLAGPPPAPLDVMSLGEIAALTWLVEALTQAQAHRAFGDRILAIDFDAFLDDPGAALRRICAHFSLTPPEPFFDQVRANPVLQRYSKAPDHAYTPEFRAQVLAQSRALNAAEIRKGLMWLEAFARRSPAAAQALSA